MRKENNMKAKKFLSLLLSLAMILTALPLAGVTAFAATSGNFEYKVLEDGTAEITDYTGNAETLDIPSKLDTYTVTSIGEYAFAFCDSLTSVTIPESVTSIDWYAFEGCDSLTEIKVDANNKNYSSQEGVLFNKDITELKQYPAGNTRETYDIPNSVKTFEINAFGYNHRLKSVTIPESVISMGKPFGECYSLTEIKVDANNKNYTSQDGVLFDKNKTELIQYPIGNTRTSYDIPNSVTSIDSNAFAWCAGLTSVTIPNSVTSIGDSAFCACSLESVTIGNGVTSIGRYAFLGTEYYNNPSNWENGVLYIDNCLIEAENDEIPENYTINYGTRVIAEEAFKDCDKLTGVTIPNSVTSIGDWAFGHCDSLTSVTIGDGVTSIGMYAFYKCSNLTSVTMGNSVTSIDDSAFCDCGNLTSVTIGNSVTSIGNYAFAWCKGLTSIIIPNSVISILSTAFYGCENLTSITISNSVTSIGSGAFLDTGYYNNPSNWENGVLYIDNCLIEAENDEIPENYKINGETRVIADGAFEDCDSLTNVTIPDSVTSIGDSAFEDCGNLTSVTIGKSVTSIGDFAFFKCDKLTGVTIPNSVTSIGAAAFEYCDSLTSVTIPDSVTSIGTWAFYWCDSLTDIYILNKDCSIASRAAITTETTIHGYAGSTAESYAKEHGNKFVAICAHSNMEKVPEKAATCTEDGNIEYYHCPDCNKNFKDKDGKEEVTDIVVKATGHKYEDGVCTVCGEKEPVNPEDPTNPDTPKPSGEVSGDGKLSTVDAKWILQNIAKSREFSDEQSKAADLNGDGKLSVVDVKWVLQIIAGMRDGNTLELIK